MGSSSVVATGNFTPAAEEPQATWTGRGVIVVYVDNSPNTSTFMGWAFSSNGGITWTVCNADNVNGCNGGPVNTAAIPGFKNFLPHASVAAEGSGSRVVYVTLADTDQNPKTAERVVASVSTDGGRTFQRAFSLNEPSLLPNDCNDGVQDMPHVGVDNTTSPATFWLVWRNDRAGGCIRRFFLDVTSTPVPLDDAPRALPLSWLGGSSGIFSAQPGGLKVQAGDGVVTVVYQDTDFLVPCKSKQETSVGWGSISSFDNGESWTGPALIFRTDHFRPCILDDAKTKQPFVTNSIRAFDFIRTSTGIDYVAINSDFESIRLFMSPAAGTLDTRNGISPWFEWCPRTNTFQGDPQTPARNWQAAGQQCLFAAFYGDNFVGLEPALAADGDGRLSVTYCEGDFASPGQLKVRYQGNVNPLQPTVPNGPDFQSTRLTLPFTPPSDIKNLSQAKLTVSQPLGSYAAIAPRSSLTGPISEPGCNGNTTQGPPPNYDFFPFWVQPNGTSPEIATRQVVLTP